jgi:hypothetical protein
VRGTRGDSRTLCEAPKSAFSWRRPVREAGAGSHPYTHRSTSPPLTPTSNGPASSAAPTSASKLAIIMQGSWPLGGILLFRTGDDGHQAELAYVIGPRQRRQGSPHAPYDSSANTRTPPWRCTTCTCVYPPRTRPAQQSPAPPASGDHRSPAKEPATPPHLAAPPGPTTLPAIDLDRARSPSTGETPRSTLDRTGRGIRRRARRRGWPRLTAGGGSITHEPLPRGQPARRSSSW